MQTSRAGAGCRPRTARLTRWCRWPHPSSERRLATYPVSFSVDYPDRALNRAATFFRIFTVIPIAIVLGAVSGGTWKWSYANGTAGAAVGTGGLLFFGPPAHTRVPAEVSALVV
jgi:hypothetical protein